MLLFSVWILNLPKIEAQSNNNSKSPSRALDSLLQEYAYMAFSQPKTGIVYEGDIPSNLTGISIYAMRLRSGSLYSRGVKKYREFSIPKGVVEQPYVERLVLVYQNLGNWSKVYYPLPNYTYLAPVMGLLAYDASNLSAKNLPELEIKASGNPINIEFSDLKVVPDGTVPKCVWFDLNGNINFSNTVSKSKCSTFQQGHFGIVVESIALAPSPEGPTGPIPRGKHKKENAVVWIIVGSVIIGLVLLIILGFFVAWLRKYNKKKKRGEMEKASDVGETLRMTSFGRTKAPAATGTRTQPNIETNYVP